jgi:leucyl-tRNA synthetase
VDANGRSWRSGAVVEKRELKQWFFRITDFAGPLLRSLDELPGWPAQVKAMQRHWIGEKQGAWIDFAPHVAAGADGLAAPPPIRVFTTRPDTMYGVTFLAVSLHHPITAHVRDEGAKAALARLCDAARLAKAADSAAPSRRGVDLKLEAIHPLTSQRLPVWAAEYAPLILWRRFLRGSGASLACTCRSESVGNACAHARGSSMA